MLVTLRKENATLRVAEKMVKELELKGYQRMETPVKKPKRGSKKEA